MEIQQPEAPENRLPQIIIIFREKQEEIGPYWSDDMQRQLEGLLRPVKKKSLEASSA